MKILKNSLNVAIAVLNRSRKGVMKSNTEVIIIGGGVIGLACAHYLLEQNASVRIIEQDVIGSGASHGNCGLLYFSDVIPLCSPGAVKEELYKAILGKSSLYIKPSLDIRLIRWLMKFSAHCTAAHVKKASTAKNGLLRYSLDLFDRFFALHDIDADFEKKGVLLVFKEKKRFEKYESTNAFLETFGYGGTALDPEKACELEPAIHKDIAGAWYSRHDWHLRPDLFVKSLKNRLIKQGLIIEEKCKLTGFDIDRGRIKTVHTITGHFKADNFILATGAWTPDLARQLGLAIPVQPGKGYSITMERPDRSCDIPCYLYEKKIVATPWKTGYRLGGTMEFSGFSDVLNKKRLKRLITGAKQYLTPSVGDPVIEEWTGFRPMTYDDMPIIGRSPNQGNLFIATGHGMLGLTLATGTGKAICDMICSGKSQIDLSAFSPDRF